MRGGSQAQGLGNGHLFLERVEASRDVVSEPHEIFFQQKDMGKSMVSEPSTIVAKKRDLFGSCKNMGSAFP